jgi:hypothetical protein
VGSNDSGGMILSSYSTCMVVGHAGHSLDESLDVGGLIGVNYGSIIASYCHGDVQGISYVGGFVGANLGSITACYSAGKVKGTRQVGGFAADGNGAINGTITRSFWNIETSGQLSSYGGTGLTTSQMQTVGTFRDAGWDGIL